LQIASNLQPLFSWAVLFRLQIIFVLVGGNIGPQEGLKGKRKRKKSVEEMCEIDSWMSFRYTGVPIG
jgi:hypothetical protein